MKRFHSFATARPQLRGRAVSVFCSGSMVACILVSLALQAAALAAPVTATAAPSAAPTPSTAPVRATPSSRQGGPVADLAGYRPRIDVAGEREVRAQLQLAGFKEPALVSAVIAFVRQKGQARVVLSKTADTLATALATPGYDPQKLSDLYDLFQVQLGEERDRTEKAEKELDTAIRWSVNKRLTATLLLAGIVGDAAEFLVAPIPPGETEEALTPEENLQGDTNETK